MDQLLNQEIKHYQKLRFDKYTGAYNHQLTSILDTERIKHAIDLSHFQGPPDLNNRLWVVWLISLTQLLKAK